MNINRTTTLQPTITVDTDAYTDGDVVGGLIDLSDLCGGGGGGVIRHIMVVDDDAESAIFKLYLFDGKPTTIADDAAFSASITAADLLKVVAVVDIDTYATLNSNVYALQTGLDISHGTGQLWGYLVLNGSTPTYTAATDLKLKITGWRD